MVLKEGTAQRVCKIGMRWRGCWRTSESADVAEEGYNNLYRDVTGRDKGCCLGEKKNARFNKRVGRVPPVREVCVVKEMRKVRYRAGGILLRVLQGAIWRYTK
jgi:hypothetical protein